MNAEPDPAGTRPGPSAAGKWILVVDDQAVMRDILERFLQAGGHFVSTAAGSEEGLAKAQLLPIDLVVLDLDMAASGGFQLAAKLKSDPATSCLPVLFIGARCKAEDLRRIAAAGTDGFLAVPFSFSDVRRMVNGLLGLPPGGPGNC